MRILIVDDSRAIQTIVKRAVQKSSAPDLDFKTASNGNDALAIAKEWRPDLVITDWYMPGMTGLELLVKLRELSRDILVGIVTTESAPSRISEARASGALFVLHKPFSDEDLVKAVDDALAPRAAAQAAGASGAPGHAAKAPAAQAASADKPMRQLDWLSALIEQTFPGEFTVSEVSSCALDTIQVPWGVGLYSFDGKKEVSGFCLLDWPAVVYLGRALEKRAGEKSAGSLQDPAVAEQLFGKVANVLEKIGAEVYSKLSAENIVLGRSQLIRQPPDRLKELMSKGGKRSDYFLTSNGQVQGRIVLINRLGGE